MSLSKSLGHGDKSGFEFVKDIFQQEKLKKRQKLPQ